MLPKRSGQTIIHQLVCIPLDGVVQEIIEKFQSENLYLTTLFVIFGLMRYLQITLVEKNSGSPTEIIFKDTIMQINLVLWVLSFVWLIYMTPTLYL